MITLYSDKYMPTDNNFSNERKNIFRRRLTLLAGTFAFGLLASSLIGSSQMSTAQAQESDDPMPVDIGCPTGAETCEDNRIMTNALHSDNNNTTIVTTLGTATTKVQPDKFSVIVGIETNGTTASEAALGNANRTQKVIAALQELGITQENQLSTISYTISPIYRQADGQLSPCIEIYPPPPECQPKRHIAGYVASSHLMVTMDAGGDISAGEVIDASNEAGANIVNGAFFFVSQEMQEQVRSSLITDAMANAETRANIAANAVGMEVSGVLSVILNDASFPVSDNGPLLESRVAANSDIGTQILPGEQQVTMTLGVVYSVTPSSSVGREEQLNDNSSDEETSPVP